MINIFATIRAEHREKKEREMIRPSSRPTAKTVCSKSEVEEDSGVDAGAKLELPMVDANALMQQKNREMTTLSQGFVIG